MNYRLLDEVEGRRSFVVVFEPGEDVVGPLTRFAQDQQLRGSSITGIGAFESARLGYFNPATQEFRQNEVNEQVEVLAFSGNVAESNSGERKLHLHVVLGCSDATTRGGHLVDARVRPTLELIISESPSHLIREYDEKHRLVLLKP